MSRSPRTGSWKAEYERRVRRNAGVPREVARGHGPVPIEIARGVEEQIKGKSRALPVATQVKYRQGVAEYERKYRGGLVTGHVVSLDFPSEKAAKRWLKTTKGISPESKYATITQHGKVWRVTLLR